MQFDSATADEEHDRWQAVVNRTAAPFLYAVRSTRIFCRPGCASRLPARQNVVFFDTPVEAQSAGFRACKRCAPVGESLPELHAAAVAKACRMIDAATEPPAVDELARAAGMSRFHFQRVFKAITGMTPSRYAAAKRGQRVREALPVSGSVTAASYDAGFNSSGRFYEHAARELGMAPAAFRKGGAGLVIRFAVAQSSLGATLVAATEKGVCAILLGDEPEPLVRDLERRFPRAELQPGGRAFERTVALVIGFIEAPKLGLELPLDLRGTLFQQRVWEALRQVPPGSTTTYSEIANRIGAPQAVRAVGQAVGANPVAVAVPCHRVIRVGGAICGYHWGVERKRQLLAREGGATPSARPASSGKKPQRSRRA
jgi:AraC family transcriptional regulator of adaptative response/methylated-DNA-[protein]-cysteine methyltransferase